MFNRIIFLTLSAIFVVISISCSGGNHPLSPNPQIGIPLCNDTPTVGVTDTFTDGTPAAGMGVLGLFEIHIDADKTNAELISIRTSDLTDTLEVVDITNFLQLAPCTDCVKIKSVALDPDGNIVLSIGIRHPFPVGDPLKPITGRNRADLHVFNIEGIVISNLSGVHFPEMNQTIADFKLVNRDGYTGYLDESLDAIFPTEATVHPYILHFDDYSQGNFDAMNPMGFESVTTPPPSGNLVMAMGCDYDYKDYVFDLTSGSTNFIFAVGCTYAVSSASKNQRFTPEYRIPQHNKKAACEVSFEVITNELAGGDTSSTAEIEIRVVDINHNIPVGSALNEMFADSSVSQILIEIPNVMINALSISGSSSVSGSGHSSSDPLIYQTTITNTSGAPEGTYAGLIKVVDSYQPGQNGNPLLSGMDGIKRVDPTSNPLQGLFNISEFATYLAFKIDVLQGNDPPVAILISNPDPPEIFRTQTINLDATSSFDPDGVIVTYDFDFDWDGVTGNFTVDASNATGLITTPPFMNTGNFIVGLRVTDDVGAYGFDSVDVTVSPGGLILVHDSTNDPDLPLRNGNDLDLADERGPCINWEPDGEYCINCAIQFWPFDNTSTLARMTATFFTTDLLTIVENDHTFASGVGWNKWHKTYMSSRINATYVSWWEVDGLQHPLAIADHTAQPAWGGGWAYMDHGGEIFVSRISGKCFCFGDHLGTIRYFISNSSDSLPFNVYQDCYHANMASGYISECRSMEDDSTGRIYLAHFDGPGMTQIRLARSTDLEVGHNWQISNIFTGGANYSEVRDPGLDIDENNNLHISFARKSNSTSQYELVYMRSNNGGDSFTSPVVISTSAYAIHDTPVKAFTNSSLGTYEFVITIYETNSQIYLNWSSDGGSTWQSSPVQISTSGVVNHDPDFDVDGAQKHIHVIFVADSPITYGDIKIANYHFEIV